MSHLSGADLPQRLYGAEQSLSGFLAPLGIQFSPLALTGNVAEPGIYNLPALTPATTEGATYTAAGTQVSDTYTGIRLWDLLNDAGGVSVTAAKNDILSKYVVATGAAFNYPHFGSLGPLMV